jgi:hypothetical protein
MKYNFNSTALIYLILLLFLFNSCFIFRHETKNTKDLYVTAAEKDLQQILEKIPIGNEESYGFKNREEFENAEIEDPIDFFTFINDSIQSVETVRLPVSVEDEFRSLATVEYIDGELHIVDFGANVLAQEIQKVCNENINYKLIGILRVYNITSDFLIMSKENQDIYIPLTSAKMYLQNTKNEIPKKYYTENEIINLLK